MVLRYRLALLTMTATLVLIVFGGLVTNTGAGLAVPDWPTTFGHNMFLYPWSAMVGGVFYEHSHRLLGALVGALTVALAAALWPAGGLLRRLGVLAMLAVVVQGVLGGLRVVLVDLDLAVVHGSLAPAFFALLAVIALVASGRAVEPVRGLEPSSRLLAAGATLLVYAQIVFGAVLTHLSRIDLHLAGAVVVYALLPVLTARLRRSGDAVAAPVARVLLVLLLVQLVLGGLAYLARFTSFWFPGALAVPVTHRLLGSLILAATAVLAVRCAGVGAVTGGRVEAAARVRA
jgi:cytochrome c oxidase assembly protein subunit 15